MGIHFLKFIHLLFALSLLSLAIYCIALIKQQDRIARLNKIMLVMSLLAALTGTLLVYPKHFTFHTPWIVAAYLLIFIFSAGIVALILLNQKPLWLQRLLYIAFIIILIGITHDAVTKTTFFSLSAPM